MLGADQGAPAVALDVEVGGLRLSNPVMPASGTFAEGLEQVFDLDRLGAFVTKTITRETRLGNPTPRVAETPEGMLNSIGIPSKGADAFLHDVVPFYRRFSPPLIVSISAPTADGFACLARDMAVPGVAGIEANISCPNLEADGRAFAMMPDSTTLVVQRLRAATDLPLWVKLTPNTADIAAVARAAEQAGADALVVANTILGMAIDVDTFRPRLGNVMGGLSGPAIKPIALRMTYQAAAAVAIPVIGCGGISTAEDAVEYLLAGATAVQVGTATFLRPSAMIDIVDGLVAFCRRRGIAHVRDLVGALSIGQAAP
ncbi:dihydroorotate dehydrogenase [Vineibacter terrae]|uniref:dihydroorotate dehydrogenase n=1 Tax=Vineibacter terrae TaxID=2586908 RepID=UPI002E33163B|nr:dihydroorotate dehydrogenase [Vineibacter terrae]HEX2884810.1 dihydroorotate dehydrogenase [Vineibacter terrae]